MTTKNKKRLEAESPPPAPIPAPPPGATLLGALLTSYRPVSPAFLLAEVLPVLLQLERGQSEDPRIDALFVGETLKALASVPGKITVITSASAGEDPVANIPWLNSYIQSFMVADCIQHAKLWLCHWDTTDGEMLQITVSSTNLTADAFRGQIQAGWTVTLPLAPATARKKAPHQALRDFLLSLGQAAHTHCGEVSKRFAALLERCAEIPGSHFVASVPGQPSPLPLLRSLVASRTARPPRLRIMTPSLGDWDTDNGAHLHAWCKAVGVPAEKVELIWPEADHAWVGASTSLDPGTWKMPAAALPALKSAKVKLLRLPCPTDGPVFDDGQAGDHRWSHAKFYEFNNGLLLGSHNWSKAAWGERGTGKPKNFELSVFVEKKVLPLSQKMRPIAGEIAQMAGQQEFDKGHWLRWAHAGWDGKQLVFEYRLQESCSALAEWFDGAAWKPFKRIEKLSRGWRSVHPCTAIAPSAVRLTCAGQEDGEQVLSVADLRAGGSAPMCVSVDSQQLADDLLLESYGGPAVTEPGRPAPPNKKEKEKGKKKNAAASDADYSLEWLVSSRNWRRLVDKWRATSSTRSEFATHSEATRLIAALGRKAGADVGAAIAQEELSALLRGASK